MLICGVIGYKANQAMHMCIMRGHACVHVYILDVCTSDSFFLESTLDFTPAKCKLIWNCLHFDFYNSDIQIDRNPIDWNEKLLSARVRRWGAPPKIHIPRSSAQGPVSENISHHSFGYDPKPRKLWQKKLYFYVFSLLSGLFPQITLFRSFWLPLPTHTH